MSKDPTNADHVDCSAFLRLVGSICLLIAIAFSGILALKQLGLIGDNLPGCGPQSACGQVTNGPFGRIPGLDWPVSFLGLAWFLGLLVAWLTARPSVANGLRWLARIGAVASVVFVFIMLADGAICPYCLFAHIGSLGFWVVIERTPTSADRNAALQWGVGIFLLATMALAGTRMWQTNVQQQQAIENEDAFLDAVLANERSNEGSDSPSGEVPVGDSVQNRVESSTPTGIDPAPPQPSTSELLQSRWTSGDPDAPVQVVMLSDYQCPDCRDYEMEMQTILNARPDVSLSVKHFPMCTDCNPNLGRNMHANACWAARAAEAAGILGGEDAFWEMHEWLFENRGRFPGGQLPPIVEDLGFDRTEFTEVMTSDETLDLVTGDISDGVTLGLFYTPMIFINGVELKWHLIPSSLTNTVNRVADAIASGQQESEQIAPPIGLDKYIADWRDGRKRFIKPSNRDFKRTTVDPNAPEVVAFIDFVSPNCASFLADLRDWESVHGQTQLILRVNPLDQACNANLPAKLQPRAGSCLAARALKTAGIVGGEDKAFEMAWWLIDNGPSLGSMSEVDIITQASDLGMDPSAFATTLNSAGVDRLIKQDVDEFKRNRFPHLPVVIVDDRQIPRLSLQN